MHLSAGGLGSPGPNDLWNCIEARDYNFKMEDFVNVEALTFLFLALMTLALIFHDAFLHANADDQRTFRR